VPKAMLEGIYKPYRDRYLAHGIDLMQQPVEIAPAAHTTCGGVLIDEACRTGIPGLLACGEVTGGLHGANRLGGNAGLETMVFGRIAGQTALQEWMETEELQESVEANRPADVDVLAIRQSLQQILRWDLGVLRTEDRLQAGLAETKRLMEALGDHNGCYEKHRLYNDLLTTWIAFTSALHRKDSIGCHSREDAVKETPGRVIVQNNAGQMTALREEI